MKLPRSRFRRVAKWVGLVCCGSTITIWAASFYVLVGYSGMSGDLYIGGGVLWINSIPSKTTLGWQIEDARKMIISHMVLPETGTLRWWDLAGQQHRTRYFDIPSWIPILAIAIPTYVLWYHDRRPTPGHCQRCGYDLTGNVSGRCPASGRQPQITTPP